MRLRRFWRRTHGGYVNVVDVPMDPSYVPPSGSVNPLAVVADHQEHAACLERADLLRGQARTAVEDRAATHQKLVDLQDLIDRRRRERADPGITLHEVQHALSKLAPF